MHDDEALVLLAASLRTQIDILQRVLAVVQRSSSAANGGHP
jgi:hypothetical protein